MVPPVIEATVSALVLGVDESAMVFMTSTPAPEPANEMGALGLTVIATETATPIAEASRVFVEFAPTESLPCFARTLAWSR